MSSVLRNRQLALAQDEVAFQSHKRTIAAQETCTDGVSKVETQHSFLNGLVGGLTLGIYTPIDITVTCAAPGGATK